jgi:hypothetical protein
MALGCENMTPLSTYWRVPVTGSGVFTGTYRWVMAGPGVTKPTPDSVKALHVKNDLSNDDYYIALQDNGSVEDYNTRCGACCDNVDSMPAVTVPDVIIEETACPDVDGNRNFFSITRALAAGEVYDFAATLDGAALAATQNQGFASLAAFETWADTNWAPAGISISGTKVTLTSATAATGSIQTNIKKYFESNAPAGLAGGQLYTLAATVNGTALANIVGAADAPLTAIATTANATAAYAALGKWSVVGGKIRLVSGTAVSAVLNVTIS